MLIKKYKFEDGCCLKYKISTQGKTIDVKYQSGWCSPFLGKSAAKLVSTGNGLEVVFDERSNLEHVVTLDYSQADLLRKLLKYNHKYLEVRYD